MKILTNKGERYIIGSGCCEMWNSW